MIKMIEFTNTNATLADDTTEVTFSPARAPKAEALQIGLAYYTAASEADDKAMDALLDAHGARLVRRGLFAFSNAVKRTGGPAEVVAAALMLKDEIKTVRKVA